MLERRLFLCLLFVAQLPPLETTFRSVEVSPPERRDELLRAFARQAQLLGNLQPTEPLACGEGDSVGIPVASSETLHQAIDWDDSETITLWVSEWNPSNGEQEEKRFSFTASHPVRTVAPRNVYEYFVAQRDGRSSEWVVEHWRIQPALGARTVDRASRSSPIGESVSYSPPKERLVGGTYIPMAERKTEPTLSVSEVYRGNHMVEITTMTADPDGRFLLVVSGPEKRLLQIPLHEERPPTVIADATTLPHLLVAHVFSPLEHEAEGRVYLLESAAFHGLRTILRDANNNGVFESATTYYPPAFEAAGYAGYVWTDDFIELP